MTRVWQRIVQVIFLALFTVLIVAGKIQLWMGIFVLSMLLAFFFGRFYCGWLCPINTLMKVVTWIKRKLKIGTFKTPRLLTHPFFRYGFLAVFLLTFVFVVKTGRKLPVLPALLLLGTGLTLLFPEELWHRYLCPYGTILQLTGARARRVLTVNAGLCNGCGRCKKVCSGGAVWKTADKKYNIEQESCLLCLDCIDNCPQGAIRYRYQNEKPGTAATG
ncbi:MAG: 4Fe-4S binding protein [Dethiobacteria bacterium]|jgi:ferredoxin-type protein NapH